MMLAAPTPTSNALPSPALARTDQQAKGRKKAPSSAVPNSVPKTGEGLVELKKVRLGRVGPDYTNPLSPDISAFVMELAAKLEPIEKVLEKYGLTQENLQTLLKNKHFRELVHNTERDFASITNTADRVRIKAMMLTELGLEEMFLILSNPNHLAAARVSAFSAIKSLTGLEKPELEREKARFHLTISVPAADGQPGKTIEVTAEELPKPEDAGYGEGEGEVFAEEGEEEIRTENTDREEYEGEGGGQSEVYVGGEGGETGARETSNGDGYLGGEDVTLGADIATGFAQKLRDLGALGGGSAEMVQADRVFSEPEFDLSLDDWINNTQSPI